MRHLLHARVETGWIGYAHEEILANFIERAASWGIQTAMIHGTAGTKIRLGKTATSLVKIREAFSRTRRDQVGNRFGKFVTEPRDSFREWKIEPPRVETRFHCTRGWILSMGSWWNCFVGLDDVNVCVFKRNLMVLGLRSINFSEKHGKKIEQEERRNSLPAFLQRLFTEQLSVAYISHHLFYSCFLTLFYLSVFHFFPVCFLIVKH